MNRLFFGQVGLIGGDGRRVLDSHGQAQFIFFFCLVHLFNPSSCLKFNVQYKQVFPPRIHHFCLGVLVDTKTFLPFFNMGFGYLWVLSTQQTEALVKVACLQTRPDPAFTLLLPASSQLKVWVFG